MDIQAIEIMLMESFSKKLLILVPVLIIIGKILKSTPFIKNWMIPYLLLVIAVTASIFLIGFGIKAFLQGIIVTGVAVYFNQLFKQLIKLE